MSAIFKPLKKLIGMPKMPEMPKPIDSEAIQAEADEKAEAQRKALMEGRIETGSSLLEEEEAIGGQKKRRKILGG